MLECKPDLVTMDITMPKMDGISNQKNNAKDPDAKIIVVSAMGQKLWLSSVKFRAKDFIVKPFQPDRIVEALQKVGVNFSCLLAGKRWSEQ